MNRKLCYMNDNQIYYNGDFVTLKNGGGFWTKSPNGTAYKVYVGDDGVLKTQKQ